MNDVVTAFMKKHQLLTRNTTVLIGVSGGPDSMALLHFLCSIREEWNIKIVAISVDHQLRAEESKADLYYVKAMCEKWNIKFDGTFLDVPSYKRDKHLGTQVAARDLRYAYFKEQMEIYQADYIALGHHGDDQIETMMMSFVRSSNPKALSGIPMKRPFATGYIIRPFLCVDKKELEDYCYTNNITPRLDPSNEETNYTRNYFRKHLLPLLKVKNSNIHNTVQRLSESLQEDEQFLMKEARKLVDHVVILDENKKKASFNSNLFETYSSALQRRAYHLILSYLYDELPKNLSYVHEEQFFALLRNERSNVKIDFPHHLQIKKEYQKIVCDFPNKSLEYSFQEIISIPGETELPDGSRIIASYADEIENKDQDTFVCDTSQISLPLHIRTRQSGDRMRWKGLKGSKKVKDIFIDAKIPLTARDRWPIVHDSNGEILWIVGLKKGYPTKQGKNTSFIQLDYDKGHA
ncbi:tRNA lysidine(34) synthetase TilS [Virgibacillus byunsanensis]|uniref:tRNA(Ile)-lysidine synthase n=1 Tax=Virgibacillus byunsanensis TaxID=570945 RepID=A0ABW3LPB4_9BACI